MPYIQTELENTLSKHTYFLCPKDQYNQPTGDIQEISLTEADFKLVRNFQYVFEKYSDALFFVLD